MPTTLPDGTLPAGEPPDPRYDRRGLLSHIRSGFQLDWYGTHGGHHWGRVRHHAVAVARARGADLLVAELFAFLHDSQREDEWGDPHHGRRGADYARSLQGVFFELKPAQLDRLAHAIRHHSGGEVSTDATIQSCWDADRLDLGRVGITPHQNYLSREGAARIEAAYRWSRGAGTKRSRAVS
jgi:uncharacterized protein